MNKLVSVIVPVYNAGKYLAETIRSVQGQTYENWELIIVNDGSTDDSENIAKQFAHDPRIRIIRQDNAGVSAARNNGLDHATGDYAAFLDADDVWLPDNLREKTEYLNSNPETGLVHSDIEVIDSGSNRTGKLQQGKEGNIIDDLLLWNGCCIPAPSSILVRTTVVRAIDGFDSRFSTAADQDLFFRIASKHKIGRIPKVLVLYRVHDDNMHQNIAVMERDHIGVYEKARKNGLFISNRFRNQCFSNLYLILAGSWWVDGKNKPRGLWFILKAVITYPPNSLKLAKKLFK